MKTPDFVADIKVGSKTIEDIKKWLACWSVTYTDACSGECETCEYDVGEKESVGMGGKTLAYIQQLESRLAQVERGRDAAVADINFYQSAVCFTCSNHIPPEEREDWRIYCKKYGRLPEVISDKRPTFCGGYNWHGVCAENTKEEGN